MPQFAYVARDHSGSIARGTLQAGSAPEAVRLLRGEGKFPLKVQASAASASDAPATAGPALPFLRRADRFRPDDVVTFAGQLSVMIETGVTLAEGLESCRDANNSPAFAGALDRVIEQVQAGHDFSAALAEHPRIFTPLFVAMIRASEASGTLALMLQRVSEYLVSQRELRKKIIGALTYPAAMLSFAIGVSIFLLTFVLPRFASIYAGKEAALPAPTRLLMALSQNLSAYGLYAGGGLLLVGVGAVFYLRGPGGRNRLDQVKLNFPLMGRMFHQAFLARSVRTLGTMLQTGVSMLEAVALTRQVCGSPAFERLWTHAHDELERGRQLSDALIESSLIPRPMLQMIRAGERGGRLGAVLERVAAHYEQALATTIKSATALLEPIVVVALGAFVGAIVISLLLPIFTISRAMHP